MKLLDSSFRTKQIAAFAAVYLIWGSTYLAILYAIETLPPWLMAGTRHLISGAVLYAWARWRGAAKPELRHWKPAAIIGALLLLCGNGSVVWAEQHIPSGLAALLIGTEPLWVVILMWLWPRGERPTFKVLGALVIGFCGAALLASPEAGATPSPYYLLASLAIIFACLTWAGGSLYARHASFPQSPVLTTGMQMLCGGAFLIPVGLLAGEGAQLQLAEVSVRSWLAFAYLIVFGSMVAFSAYSWLVRTTEPTMVATYAYVNPVVAVFLGWFLADEPFGLRTLIATILIVTSVVLTTLVQNQKARLARQSQQIAAPSPEPPTERQPTELHAELEKCA